MKSCVEQVVKGGRERQGLDVVQVAEKFGVDMGIWLGHGWPAKVHLRAGARPVIGHARNPGKQSKAKERINDYYDHDHGPDRDRDRTYCTYQAYLLRPYGINLTAISLTRNPGTGKKQALI